MPITLSNRTVDMDFIDKVEKISGQPFKICMQCGTCSTVCPMEENAVHTPRRLIHLAQFGQSEEVLKADLSWYCVSCHVCMVRCPRGLDIPRIMETFRLLSLRNNEDYVAPQKIDKEQLKDMPQVAMVSSFRKHTA